MALGPFVIDSPGRPWSFVFELGVPILLYGLDDLFVSSLARLLSVPSAAPGLVVHELGRIWLLPARREGGGGRGNVASSFVRDAFLSELFKILFLIGGLVS